jgi:hypothetical protein
MTEEWLMSKRVATATRLSVDWRGPWSTSERSQARSRFYHIEHVNFRRTLIGPRTCNNLRDGETFTLSNCGRYLLVMSDHDVFLYNLHDASDTMTAVVRLAANCKVLRVSMDTSSGRFAVAALLENRSGALWDLTEESTQVQPHRNSGEPMSLGLSTEVYGSTVEAPAESMIFHLPLRRREFTSITTANVAEHANRREDARHQALREAPDSSMSHMSSQPFFEISDSFCSTPKSELDAGPNTGIPIRSKPTAIYRDLGSPGDIPRSVAICPSRKCVAFGCRLGIELHWVDALTGGDLCRWFPLAAPSDYLYFLPQRAGIDSSKKLRLISSAAGPSIPSTSRSESLPARLKLRADTHDRGRRQSMTRLFFGNLPFPASAVFSSVVRHGSTREEEQQGVLRTVDCDHYQAIPLSDGSHMLYTDPVNGLLCLGSDAPLGGPTKLIRKAIFVPPPASNDDWASLMSCYNAGQDLQWGVQVVAAHRDGRIILYNVPADLFALLRSPRQFLDVWDETAGVLAQSDLMMDDVLSTHPNTLTEPMMGNTSSVFDSELQTPLRTVQIEGSEIGHVGRDIVDDVAVDTTTRGVSVWIFCRSGLARLLDIYTPNPDYVRTRLVGSDGILYDSQSDTHLNSQNEPGRRSPKGKERAHEDEDEDTIRQQMRSTGFDGACDASTDVPDVPTATKETHKTTKAEGGHHKEKKMSTRCEKVQIEILTGALPIGGAEDGAFEIEILTDWRDQSLFAPDVVLVG